MKLLVCFVLLAFSLLFCSSRAAESPDSGTLVDGDKCKVIPEVVLLLDVSQSYHDDLLNLVKLMPDLLTYFTKHFDGHARFGIATFKDKGILPFGYDGTQSNIEIDYCLRVNLPLIPFSSARDVQTAQSVFGRLVSGGGFDYIDGANEAMFRAAASNMVGWSSETHDAETGRPILRILALLTDAPIHDPGHYTPDSGVKLPAHDFLTNAEEFEKLHKDPNYRCTATDYPFPASIKTVLDQRSITPVVLSGRPVKYDKTKKEWVYWQDYRHLLKRYKKQGSDWDNLETGLQKYYEWYMGEQVGVTPIVELIKEDSSNFVKVFEDAIGRAKNLKCLSRNEKNEESDKVGNRR